MTNEIDILKTEIEELKKRLATSVAYGRKLKKHLQTVKVKSGNYKHNADVFEKALMFYSKDKNYQKQFDYYGDGSSSVQDDSGWTGRKALEQKNEFSNNNS